MIEIDNVKKNYGNFEAIKSLNLKIKKGEILGFLGPNGAGKSTTMRMITGFTTTTEGDIFILDQSVKENSLQTRKKIGYLPESNPLYPELKVEEFLDFVGGLRNLKGEYKKERIEFVIKRCALQEKRNSLISTLSKGYKQRVGLAQALLADPEILILDEPTIGLDPNQIIEIRKLIKDVSKDKTIIFCSHILSEVEAICSRVVIIDNGKIKTEGSITELTTLEKGESHLEIVVNKVSKKMENSIGKIAQIIEKIKIDRHTKYVLKTENKNLKTLKEKILKELIAQKIELIALKDKTVSLEDVFRNLTN